MADSAGGGTGDIEAAIDPQANVGARRMASSEIATNERRSIHEVVRHCKVIYVALLNDFIGMRKHGQAHLSP